MIGDSGAVLPTVREYLHVPVLVRPSRHCGVPHSEVNIQADHNVLLAFRHVLISWPSPISVRACIEWVLVLFQSIFIGVALLGTLPFSLHNRQAANYAATVAYTSSQP